MKMISILMGAFALLFIVAHLWLGPVYRMYDGCICGQHRTWISFDDSTKFRGTKLFVRITSPGDLHHSHEYTDPVYDTHPVLGFIGVGFGLAGVVVGFYPRQVVLQHV
jgi:hypothetical protein